MIGDDSTKRSSDISTTMMAQLDNTFNIPFQYILNGEKNLARKNVQQWISCASRCARNIVDKCSQEGGRVEEISAITSYMTITFTMHRQILAVFELDPTNLTALFTENQERLSFEMRSTFSKVVMEKTAPENSNLGFAPCFHYGGREYAVYKLQKYGNELIETCAELVSQIACSIFGTENVGDRGLLWGKVGGECQREELRASTEEAQVVPFLVLLPSF
eukprot:Phypoly_transcript_12925.p1 GENE.Phypoly_transcript_12925~~Phypoly_transcript_12925.p1  ORF type:complete len:219 (+),score=27.21 Phypoly_transcript_12925:249-905(+)